MHILVIDTSSAAVTAGVAVVGDDAVEVLAEQVTVDARAHGERLAPSIAVALAESDVELSQLRAVVAGLGPGPFTGLRVGLVTAEVMADALGIPTYGVCSLDGIAGALDAASLLVAGDARRHEVYWARYADGVRVAGPEVARPADVPVTGVGGVGAMAGAGARLYADVLGLPLLDADYPSLLALARAAADRVRGGAASEPLVPLYLRRPDAVQPGRPKAVTP